jgi:hypothetical membrane protein
MKHELVTQIRRLQIIIMSVVFVLVTALCWSSTGFDIREIQVSEWGGDTHVADIWNTSLALISIAVLFNVIVWIKRHARLGFKKLFYVLFSIVSLSLLIVAIFPHTHGALHNVPAFIYFFAYPLVIFFMAFLNRRKLLLKEWTRHLVISICMITLPLLFLNFFNGYAISEIIHSVIVIIWNISILGLGNKK